jgi:hypothetical protein
VDKVATLGELLSVLEPEEQADALKAVLDEGDNDGENVLLADELSVAETLCDAGGDAVGAMLLGEGADDTLADADTDAQPLAECNALCDVCALALTIDDVAVADAHDDVLCDPLPELLNDELAD